MQIIEIVLLKKSKMMQVEFENGMIFQFPAEYLRVSSPSAEVRGHGMGQEILQVGKRDVGIVGLETVGHYALKITFDDGHDSGLYTWDYLYELAQNYTKLWQDYLDRLEQAKASRG